LPELSALIRAISEIRGSFYILFFQPKAIPVGYLSMNTTILEQDHYTAGRPGKQ